jgi:hypothetical protein
MPPLAAALKTKFDDNDPNIEVVALVGKIPQTRSPEQQQQLLRSINGRMITYDTLIQEALDSYNDYLEADERVSRLNTILDKVGATVEAETENEDETPDENASEAEQPAADAERVIQATVAGSSD